MESKLESSSAILSPLFVTTPLRPSLFVIVGLMTANNQKPILLIHEYATCFMDRYDIRGRA